MLRVVILNLIWILIGFSFWVFLDFVYVKIEEFQSFADTATIVLFFWPLILLIPVIKELSKEKNKVLKDKFVAPSIVIGSLVFQYAGTFALIITLGIGFHFSIGGTL